MVDAYILQICAMHILITMCMSLFMMHIFVYRGESLFANTLVH